MSRLGKKPIELPKGVDVKVEKGKVCVKGPKGAHETKIPEGVIVSVNDSEIVVSIDEKSGLAKSMHGLYRMLISNSIEGVFKGFEKQLALVGVGYRAAVKGNALDMQLGFSHPAEVKIPEGVSVKVEKSTAITITGVDKQLVGQFAANVRILRPPEPYKGKGVRYKDEFVRKKAGKAAKGK
jgi:large subunit ribosomal protein L6